jgi:hypothetical protein
MHFRWWNSFNLLAVILLAVGIIGGIQGKNMVFDPGRPSSGHEWILYLVAGVLMLINGFLPPSHSQEDEKLAENSSRKVVPVAGVNKPISGE